MAGAPSAAVAESCRNCGAALQGRFCHSCGQRVTTGDLTLHEILHEALDEFLHLDGKILQTLKLLVLRPGGLTREFLAGRRARYVSPVRLYLTCSILFFALAAALPGAQASMIRVQTTERARDGQPSVSVSFGESKEHSARALEAERLREGIMHNLPRVVFVLMPVFALLTWLFYRRVQPYYIPHLYYSIHFHAFVFLVLSGVLLLAGAGTAGRVAGQLVFVGSIFPYHYIGLRRVFGGTAAQTARRGTAVGLLYWVAVGAAMVALMFFVLFTRP